jgi:hypothetical protein
MDRAPGSGQEGGDGGYGCQGTVMVAWAGCNGGDGGTGCRGDDGYYREPAPPTYTSGSSQSQSGTTHGPASGGGRVEATKGCDGGSGGTGCDGGVAIAIDGCWGGNGGMGGRGGDGYDCLERESGCTGGRGGDGGNGGNGGTGCQTTVLSVSTENGCRGGVGGQGGAGGRGGYGSQEEFRCGDSKDCSRPREAGQFVGCLLVAVATAGGAAVVCGGMMVANWISDDSGDPGGSNGAGGYGGQGGDGGAGCSGGGTHIGTCTNGAGGRGGQNGRNSGRGLYAPPGNEGNGEEAIP